VAPAAPGAPAQTGNGAGGVAGATTGSNGSTAGTTSLNGKTPSVVKKATVKIVSVQMINTRLGRYLGLRLSSTASTAKVRIVLYGANHKQIGVLIRTVRTNTLVRVVKLSKHVGSVKVSPYAV
jgi:hypothetical protein